jgi:hypothetical protein
MIKKIIVFYRFCRMGTTLTTHFCSKADILKTYLEIIPPHKIYELMEKK